MIELPDVNRMFELVEEISSSLKEKLYLENKLKFMEAEITKTCVEDKKYWLNDKPPSQAFIDNTWKITGFNEELIGEKMRLATITADLERSKMLFYLHKDVIDIYRTQSANERLL